jgi:hypothetical protein
VRKTAQQKDGIIESRSGKVVDGPAEVSSRRNVEMVLRGNQTVTLGIRESWYLRLVMVTSLAVDI